LRRSSWSPSLRKKDTTGCRVRRAIRVIKQGQFMGELSRSF
jgi:hypothetical protein